MWDDYYSWHQVTRLAQPIILSGFYGSPVAQIGRFITSLSGIQCIDCERIIEHKLSCRLARWVLSNELEDLESKEHQLLQKSLSETPHTIILLSTHSIFHPSIQQLISEKEHTGMIITRSRAAMWNSLQALWSENLDRFINIDREASLDQIHHEYLDWLAECPKSWIRQPMQTEAPLDIARNILSRLDIL